MSNKEMIDLKTFIENVNKKDKNKNGTKRALNSVNKSKRK